MQLKQIVGVALLVAGATGAAAEPITFQGLSGGATRLDVGQRFPKARSQNLCRDGLSALTPNGWGPVDCNVLVGKLAVFDRTFDLAFYFKIPSQRLYVVQLSDTSSFNPNARATKSQILSDFSELKSILSSNHGVPVRDPPCPEQDTDQDLDYCAMWQGMPVDYFDPSIGEIELSADGYREGPQSVGYMATYTISYKLTLQAKGL